MAETEALAQLREIHLPPAVGWWPPAPGWYLVAIIILITVAGVAYLVDKKHRHGLPKKRALELLAAYEKEYQQNANAQLFCARISELLKRVALAYYPRENVASIHGEAWIDFLNNTAQGIDFKPVKSLLLDAPFKASEAVNPQPLVLLTQTWIKQRGVPCSN